MSKCGECYYNEKKSNPCNSCGFGNNAKYNFTNADRIRHMTDEELAEFLFEVEYRRSAQGNGAKWQSKEDTLKYLQEEVEG